MNIIYQDNDYLSDIDVLCRVYKNQASEHPEEEQIASEVLYRPYMMKEHSHATSWLPSGAVAHIVQELNGLIGDFKIQISNELDDTIGVLTSCRDNFNNNKHWRELKHGK